VLNADGSLQIVKQAVLWLHGVHKCAQFTLGAGFLLDAKLENGIANARRILKGNSGARIPRRAHIGNVIGHDVQRIGLGL